MRFIINSSLSVDVYKRQDGAFKDPVGKIWELADPVVSPAYTSGLEGQPNELKLKYLADNDFANLSGEALTSAIKESISHKEAEDVYKRQLPNGCSGVISFSLKGGREVAVKWMDSLQLANNVVHVADICTCVLHPASALSLIHIFRARLQADRRRRDRL